ncbi:omega-hydroxyceramide transacylase [Aplochiton taeniatus]
MSPVISSYSDVLPSISFSGSGFLSTYQLGVVQALLDRAPWVIQAAPFILGASAGSLVAASVACKLSPDIVRDEILTFAQEVREHPFGPLDPAVNVFSWIERVVRKCLPRDAHRLANGRLAVAMTSMLDTKNTLMTEFQSREDVIQALRCSCFVPVYCGMLPPSYKGVHYVDGGFTSIQPQQATAFGKTLTVSPFSGEVDICPRDSASLCDVVVSGAPFQLSLANTLRVINALYPPSLEVRPLFSYRKLCV